MKRFTVLCLLAIMILASTACSAATPEPTATPIPLPSETPEPTSTPLPTETSTLPPTNTPTATPDKTATAMAKATEAAVSVVAELDELLADSDIPYQEGSLLWKQDESVSVKLSEPGGRFVDIDGNPKASDFVLKSDITWDTTGIVLCGVILRSEKDIQNGKHYQFLYMRLSGAPAWAIEFHDFGQYKNSFTDVKYSDALNLENGATNQVVIVAQKEQFTVYINGVRQGKFYDYSKQALDGTFAFIAFEDSGKSTCKFENTWIWALP